MSGARDLTAALGGRWHGRSGSARCPAHGDRNPSLSLSDGAGGRLLWHCHAGCLPLDVLAALRRLGLVPGDGRSFEPDPSAEAARRAVERAERELGTRRARNLWAETAPIRGTLAERYLRARAVRADLPDALRFHPRCWHPSAVRLPAMLAAVTLRGEVVGVHRSYLAEPGRKAEAKPEKAMLGPVMGGAVRLSDGAGSLVVAEGIETSLSLLDALSDASPRVWATLSAAGMAGLSLPDGRPGELVVAPDRDASGTGQRAADKLAGRAAALGWRVRIMEPPGPGRDWNDLAMEAAREHA